MDMSRDPVITSPRARSAEVVRVPVKTILYLQAMAENGREDRPKPIGFAPPWDHVCYRQ